MTGPDPQWLRDELARAMDAAAQSDEQVRNLLAILENAGGTAPDRSATDASKLVAATLATSARLHERVAALKRELHAATWPAMSPRPQTTGDS